MAVNPLADTDPIVDAVCAELQKRSAVGWNKYGVWLTRTDLTRKQWLQHLFEELLDAACYTKRLMMEEGEPEMTEIQEKVDWTICGRRIGRASGWDHGDTWAMQIYDLEPGPGYKGPVAGCINIDFENGKIEAYDNEGGIVASCDLIEAIIECPIDRIESK